MAEVYLTVREVAELKGCTERSVRALIGRCGLQAEVIEDKAFGQVGIQYRIPLSALDPKHQRKYKRIQLKAMSAATLSEPLPEPEPTDFECLSEHERLQITFWKGVLRDWNEYRCETREKGGSKGEADIEFVRITAEAWAAKPPIISNAVISTSILYSKQKALRTKGEAGLIDRRGKHGKHSRKLTREMQQLFEDRYLIDSAPSVDLCVSAVKQDLIRIHGYLPEMPSVDTFERYVKTMSIPLLDYFRKGLEVYISKDEPYIRQMYDDLESNDIWVADGHIFDVDVRGRDGKPFRPHLTIFMDERSRKMMGWVVSDRFCADTTIYAMKKGVEKYGLPRAIQVDNGREYLFYDLVGTAGFRKKAKPKPGDFRPPPILEILGVHVRVNLPKNSRGKVIERAFGTIKEQFSKLFGGAGYTGGSVAEKPDSLKPLLKNPEKLMSIEEFSEAVNVFLTGHYNKRSHRGAGMYGRSPDECYADELVEQRMILEGQLNLMFMRYSKNMMTVGKNGVTLKLYGECLQFSNPDLWYDHKGRKVYVRYAPDDLSSVRVYDKDNRFICVAEQVTALSRTASTDEIRQRQKANRSQSNRVRNYDTTHGRDELTTFFDAVIAEARQNLQTPETLNPQRMTIVAAIEEPEPGGRLEVGIDRDVLLKHAQEAEPSQNRINRLRAEPSAMSAIARQQPEPEEPVNRIHEHYLRIALERRSAMVV